MAVIETPETSPDALGLRPFHEFDGANETWPRGDRPAAIRGGGNRVSRSSPAHLATANSAIVDQASAIAGLTVYRTVNAAIAIRAREVAEFAAADRARGSRPS